MLSLKESEQSYYAFLCNDLLSSLEIKWYLRSDVSPTVDMENNKTEVWNYDEYDQNFIILSFDDRLIITFEVPLL